MNIRLQKLLKVSLICAAVAAGPAAWADGVAGKLAGKVREQTEAASASRENRRAESRPEPRGQARGADRAESRAPRPQPSVEPRAPRSQPSSDSRSPRPQPSSDARTPQPSADARAPRLQPRVEGRTPRAGQHVEPTPVAPAPRQPTVRDNDRSPDRGLTGSLIQREYQGDRDRGNDGGRGDHDGRGNDRDRDRGNNGHWDRDHRDRDWYRNHRPGHVVHRLPAGYRDYRWNGGHYYYHGGHWYRPYGASFISIGIPYGLFVTTLPGSYTSVWYGGTRYFYSDYNYYTYEPARRGYVVVESPYGDDEEYVDSRLDQDLYIYPARGQSEQQQADDRYECHRWAVDQSDYDPIDDEYDAALREDYLRAMTACLTGRGYTVR